MQSESHLALIAILTALRRTGAIDRQAIRAIIETLEEASCRVAPRCGDTAAELDSLAAALREGPARSCSFAALVPEENPVRAIRSVPSPQPMKPATRPN